MPQLSRYKKLIALVVVTITLFWMISVTSKTREQVTFAEKTVGYVVTPIQKAFNYVYLQINETYLFFREIGALKGEKERLSLRIQVLEDENRQLNDIKKENDRLKQMLDIKGEYKNFTFENAQVIGRDLGQNWDKMVVIDKGSDDGLKVNAAVLSVNKGLVGRVIEVGPAWSKVMLITDPESSVSSMIDRTRDLAVVRGDAFATKYGLVKLTYLLPDTDVIVGDTIMSSGFGGIFPKGVLIGKVKEIKQEPGELIKYAYIEPASDFKRLEEVVVVKSETRQK